MKTRRLAAIMFTDIAGYTQLMQKSEALANKIRQRHREVFERHHQQFNGEILQYYGDGTLSIFQSCVDAVHCAIAMQHELQQQPTVPLRIGVHLGDIVKSDSDVYGDGVNVAARVESLGLPGAVLISDEVRKQIKNQEIDTVSMGYFELKNVAVPIEVFAIKSLGLALPKPEELGGKANRMEPTSSKGSKTKRRIRLVALSAVVMAMGAILVWMLFKDRINQDQLLEESIRTEKVAVAVFNNDTGDPLLDALGFMASDWISSGLRELQVKTTSPEMMRRYRDKVGILPNNPEGQVSLFELTDAPFVVTGSYYQTGDSLQVTSRLESNHSGDILYEFPPVWALKSQKESMIAEIREQLKGYWSVREAEKLSNINPPKYEAYQAYLECHMFDPNCFRKVLELDSTFLLAHVYYAFILYSYEDAKGYETRSQYIKKHWDFCTEFEQNFFLFIERYREADYKGALVAIMKNHELDRKDLTMLHHVAYSYLDLNQPANTAEQFEKIFSQYDIYGDRITWQSHDAYFFALNRLGRHKEVIAFEERVAENFNDPKQFIRAYMLDGDIETLRQRLPGMHASDLIRFAQMFGAIFPPETENIYLPLLRDSLTSFDDPKRSWNYLVWSNSHMYNWDSKAYAHYLLKEWDQAEKILLDLKLKDQDWNKVSDGVIPKSMSKNVSWHMGVWVEGLLGAALARQGKKDDAYAQIETLEAMRPGYPTESQRLHRGTISYWQARIFAILTDQERAVAALTRAMEEGRTIDYGSFVFDWDLAGLKGYAPYEQLIRPKLAKLID